MGNLNSIYNMYNKKYTNKNCSICNMKTELHNLVQCHRCHIKLHDYCYEKYSHGMEYTLCPNPECQKIGTLGQEFYYKNKYLEKQRKNENVAKETVVSFTDLTIKSSE